MNTALHAEMLSRNGNSSTVKRRRLVLRSVHNFADPLAAVGKQHLNTTQSGSRRDSVTGDVAVASPAPSSVLRAVCEEGGGRALFTTPGVVMDPPAGVAGLTRAFMPDGASGDLGQLTGNGDTGRDESLSFGCLQQSHGGLAHRAESELTAGCDPKSSPTITSPILEAAAGPSSVEGGIVLKPAHSLYITEWEQTDRSLVLRREGRERDAIETAIQHRMSEVWMVHHCAAQTHFAVEELQARQGIEAAYRTGFETMAGSIRIWWLTHINQQADCMAAERAMRKDLCGAEAKSFSDLVEVCISDGALRDRPRRGQWQVPWMRRELLKALAAGKWVLFNNLLAQRHRLMPSSNGTLSTWCSGGRAIACGESCDTLNAADVVEDTLRSHRPRVLPLWEGHTSHLGKPLFGSQLHLLKTSPGTEPSHISVLAFAPVRSGRTVDAGPPRTEETAGLVSLNGVGPATSAE